MEEEFFFESNEDAQRSVERYEEMLRNQDQYFFDAGAFEYIVDFYIEKNDPVKALQVVDFAISQHPYATVFLIKQAHLYILTNNNEKAFIALQKAELLEPSEPDIYLLRGNIFQNTERYDEALENYEKALGLAESTD
jgi:tetratricopeptide (TPR) repeat protein